MLTHHTHSRLDLSESAFDPDSSGMLYAELESAVRRAAPSASRASTLLASLSCFMHFVEKHDDHVIGPELLDLTEAMAQSFTRWMLDFAKLAPATAHKRVQHVRQLSHAAQALTTADRLPGSFGASLRVLARRHRMSLNSIAAAVGLSSAVLHSWAKGTRPQHKQREAVQRIERLLSLPKGALESRLEFLQAPSDESRRTTFAARRSRHTSKPGDQAKVWIDFEHIRGEWTDYLIHKVDDMRPEVLKPANPFHRPVWRAKSPASCGVNPRPQLRLPNGMVVPSAGIAYGHIATYLGWIRDEYNLPDCEAATLAWLVDHKAVIKHAHWKAKRSDGIWHSGIKDFFAQVRTMTRPSSGYLWQNPMFAQRIVHPLRILGYDPFKIASDADRTTRWQEACAEANRLIAEFSAQRFPPGKKGVPHSRKPQEALHPFMVDKSPLQRMLKRLNEFSLKLELQSWSRGRIKGERDLLLLQMLAANPLRISQYAMMQYRADNTGNLYRSDSGQWRVRFRAVDFKNTEGAAYEDYDVPVPSSLWPRIESYLAHVRPRLLDSDQCDFMFLPTVGAKRPDHATEKGLMWDADAIVTSLKATVMRCIPEAKGFGAHSMRHLAATNYLRMRPGDVEGLSKILNDTIETVRRTYLSQLTEPAFERIGETFDEVFLAALE